MIRLLAPSRGKGKGEGEKVGTICWWTNSFEGKYEATNEATKQARSTKVPFPDEARSLLSSF